MTDKEALTLALEVLLEMSPSGPIGSEIWHKQMNAIRVASDALAQPDAFEQGRQEGMKQERALWELSRLGQEIEAQPEHQPNCASLTTMLTSMPPKPASCDCNIKPPPAQPEQEPVAIVDANDDGYWADILPDRSVKVGQLLYTAPPQRPWVGLTEVDILAESKHWKNPEDFMDGVYWAETTLKEKNTCQE